MTTTEHHDRASVEWSLLIVRLAAGAIFAMHGAQKMFGAFGGAGLAKLVDSLGPVGYLVAVGEFFGGIGLMVGLLCRFSAAANIVIMIGAIAMVHGKNGFFLSDGGYEYNVALIALLAPTVLAGPGRVGIGRWIPFVRGAKAGGIAMIVE